jgi:putative nucleotidyltransferase with HDIG domain
MPLRRAAAGTHRAGRITARALIALQRPALAGRAALSGTVVALRGRMVEPTAAGEDGAPSASDKMRELVRRVAGTCDLPPLPAVASRALSLARSQNTKADDLAKVVLTDGPLAARVLKISRSVLYARRHPPSTLREAIVTVGFAALRKILIAASARTAYRVDDAIAQQLWAHALATALAADELAVVAGQPRGGDSFIAGLLHDIGRLVFHLSDPEGYRSVIGKSEADEEAVFGVHHAAVGACLATQWGLDQTVSEAILLHHADDAAPLARRLATADRIAREIGYGSWSEERAPDADAAADGDAAVAAASPDQAHAALLERVTESFETERNAFN